MKVCERYEGLNDVAECTWAEYSGWGRGFDLLKLYTDKITTYFPTVFPKY